jgi:hypothetical protein
MRIVEGRLGLIGVSGRPPTFSMYLPASRNDPNDLVHESLHVWQFQLGGTGYIGTSALHQLDSMIFSKDYQRYR